MTWAHWLRSRMVASVMAFVLSVPMGLPPAFAYARIDTSELSAPKTDDTGVALSAVEAELASGEGSAAKPGEYYAAAPIGEAARERLDAAVDAAPALASHPRVLEIKDVLTQHLEGMPDGATVEALVALGIDVLAQPEAERLVASLSSEAPARKPAPGGSDTQQMAFGTDDIFGNRSRLDGQAPDRIAERQAGRDRLADLGATVNRINRAAGVTDTGAPVNADAPVTLITTEGVIPGTLPFDRYRAVEPETGAYVHREQFGLPREVYTRLEPYVVPVVDDLGRTRMSLREDKKEALRPIFAELAYDSVLHRDKKVRDAARWAIRELAAQYGVVSSSAHDYYQAIGKGEIKGQTMPAINVRWRGLEMDRAIFRAAKRTNAGGYFLEVAASEEGYTGVGHDYGGVMAEALAAAVLEGVDAPLYMKMDHTQVDAKAYKKDPKAEIAKLKAKITRGLEAGFMNVDLDSSTIEAQPKYVELEVTTWVRQALKDGKLDRVFTNAAERGRLIAELTVPNTDEVRFNESALDAILVAVSTMDPNALNGVTFGWAEGEAEQPLLHLTLASSRQHLQYQWDLLQQSESAEVYLELAEHTRREAERIHGTREIALGAEVGEVGKKFNTTLSQVKAFLDIVVPGLRAKSLEGPNVFSVQSGAAHGGQFDPKTGEMIRDVSVDWKLLQAVSKMVRTEKYGWIAGSEQHGFSTVAEAKLSMLPEYDAAEVHLATEYANILLYGFIFGDPVMAGHKIYVPRGTMLTDEMKWKLVHGAIGDAAEDEAERQALFKSIVVVEFQPASQGLQREFLRGLQPLIAKAELIEKDTELTIELLGVLRKQGGKFKDVVKKVAQDQRVLELMWNLPEHLARPLADALETKFVATFERLNARNTREQATRLAKAPADDRAPRPTREADEALANIEVTTLARPPRTPVAADGKDNVLAIAAATIGVRGDTTVTKGEKDKLAQDASDAVTIVQQNTREHVMAIEGSLDVSYDELQAGNVHEIGVVVNPYGVGEDVYVLRDDIEVTNGFHTNNEGVSRRLQTAAQPGSTSLRAWGEAIKNHGVVPEMYGMVIAAQVPPAKVAEYDERPLDPLFDPLDPHDELLGTIKRLAGDNGRDLNDVEVVIMLRKREQAILKALERIQETYPGLTITQVSDGSVDPARLAMAGREGGKYLIAIEVGKSTEGTQNMFESAILHRSRGAVFGMRYASKNVNNVFDKSGNQVFKTDAEGKPVLKDGQPIPEEATDQRNAFRWSKKETADLKTFRPQDADAILAGTKLFTPNDVKGDVEIAVPHLSDNPWFRLRGSDPSEDGQTVRVRTARLSSKEAREQGADLWIETDDPKPSAVARLKAEAPYVLHDPGASDAAVAQYGAPLVTLMSRAGTPQRVAAEASVISQSPGFAIAWRKLLERSQQEKGLKSVDEAAKASGLQLEVSVPLAVEVDDEKGQRTEVTFFTGPNEETLRIRVREAAKKAEQAVPGTAVVVHQYPAKDSGDMKVVVGFRGPLADQAARVLLAGDAELLAKRRESVVSARAKAEFAQQVNAGSKGAAGWTPAMFNLVNEPSKEGVAIAIGSRQWLARHDVKATAKAVYDPASESGKVRPSAAPLLAAAEVVDAATTGRAPKPDLLAKLNVTMEEGLLVTQEYDTLDEAATALQDYRRAVSTVGGGA